jgi:hypothetical protein
MRIGRGNGSTRRKPAQCHSVDHTSHMSWPGLEPGLPRWEADDQPPELRHGLAGLCFQHAMGPELLHRKSPWTPRSFLMSGCLLTVSDMLHNASGKTTASFFMVKEQASCCWLIAWLTFRPSRRRRYPDTSASSYQTTRCYVPQDRALQDRLLCGYQTAIRSPAPLAQSDKFNGYTLKGLGSMSALQITGRVLWSRITVTDAALRGERFRIYADTVRLCKSATSLARMCSGLVWLTCKYDFVPTVSPFILRTRMSYLVQESPLQRCWNLQPECE